MTTAEQLSAQLDRLAAIEPGPFPVISLYLNMQPDQNGRDNFEPFLRKELAERTRTYAADRPERQSLEQDAEKIREYMKGQVEASANGLALFACAASDLFEAVQLAAPIAEHRLFVSDQPHLYPLARLIDEYPKYAALVADTNAARIFVFAANAVQHEEAVEGKKTRRNKAGGWSQARYQRHIENYHVHHAKEVVDTLQRIVRDESIQSVVIGGDEAIVKLLKDQLAKDVADRIVDVVKIDIRAPLHEILAASSAALREKDVDSDRERVEELLGAYRADGLACAGVEETQRALQLGQVDELILTARPETIAAASTDAAESQPAERSAEERLADDLIAQARSTAAGIRFIQDASLLEPIGGVGAFLRFKV